MFKIPDWEDTPNVNLSFPKKIREKRLTNKKEIRNVPESPKLNGVVKPKFKSKNLNQKISKTKNLTQKTDKLKSENKKVKTNCEIQHPKKYDKLFDTDKLDELILNEKKQKLNSYKRDDMEEILFNDSLESEKNRNMQLKNNENKYKNEISKQVIPLQNDKLVQEKNDKNKKNSKSPISQKNNSEEKSKPDNKTTKKINQLQNQNKIVKNKVEKRKKSLQDGSNNDKIQVKGQLQNSFTNKTKDDRKRDDLKSMLENKSHRNSVNVNGNKLRERMLERLKAAQFRYLNEKLYTSSGSVARELFQEDPGAFQVYHDGYQQQVKRWPIKPLDIIVKRIQKMPKTHSIADMGCGEAELSTRVVQTVRSFDLVASKVGVEICDMAHTPLLSSSMDVAVYCLALMGTDLTQYLVEANRILKVGGHLLIAEVESRFHDINSFTSDVQKLGFSLKKMDKSHKVFFFMEFTKVREPPVKKGKLPVLTLKPCIYKKR